MSEHDPLQLLARALDLLAQASRLAEGAINTYSPVGTKGAPGSVIPRGEESTHDAFKRRLKSAEGNLRRLSIVLTECEEELKCLLHARKPRRAQSLKDRVLYDHVGRTPTEISRLENVAVTTVRRWRKAAGRTEVRGELVVRSWDRPEDRGWEFIDDKVA